MSPWWKLDPYNVNRENRDQRERVAADGVSSVARGGGRSEAAGRAASAFSATRTVPPGATSPSRRDPGPGPGGGQAGYAPGRPGAGPLTVSSTRLSQCRSPRGVSPAGSPAAELTRCCAPSKDTGAVPGSTVSA